MHGSEGSITEEKGHIHLDYWNKIELEIAHNAVHLDVLRYFERDLLETVVLSSAISQRFFFLLQLEADSSFDPFSDQIETMKG